MIKYRVECKVQKVVAADWEEYFVETHLDDVLNTDCFTGYAFDKSIEKNEDTITFVSEYFCSSLDKLKEYNEKFAPIMKQDILSKFEGKFIARRSIFEVITKK